MTDHHERAVLEPCLGVDFGRVIHGGGAEPGAEDTVFRIGELHDALDSPATAGAFEVLPRLVQRFAGRVWIISKCRQETESRTLRWLDYHDFYRRTGMPQGNIRFCRQRADKAIHCAQLGITHMIDDRLDVHRAIRGLVPHRYLFGPQTDPVPDWVRHTPTWADVEAAIIAEHPGCAH